MFPDDNVPAETGNALTRAVYQDVLQPAAREVGHVLGRAVHVALAPVRGLVWTAERAEDWLEKEVSARLEKRGVPESSVVTPPPLIMAGVIRGLQVAGPDPDPNLRDLFANLLATAMTEGQTESTHPAFAEILAQLTSDEARILRTAGARATAGMIIAAGFFEKMGLLMPHSPIVSRTVEVTPLEVDLSAPRSLPIYWDNLQRLRLLQQRDAKFEWANTQVTAETDSEYDQRRKGHWRLVRGYAQGYGVPELAAFCNEFETTCRASPEPPKGATPGIVLAFAWPTSFGDRLLRASLDPAEYGSRSVVNIEGVLSEPLDDNRSAAPDFT